MFSVRSRRGKRVEGGGANRNILFVFNLIYTTVRYFVLVGVP